MDKFDFDVVSEAPARRPWRPLPSNRDGGRPSDGTTTTDEQAAQPGANVAEIVSDSNG